MILVVGNSGAIEIDSFELVREIWGENDLDSVFFAQDKCLDGEYMNYRVNGITSYSLTINDKEYDVGDFSGIWYLKPHLPEPLWRHENVEYRHFIQRQFYEMRSALWSLFSDKIWLNDPWALQEAENKIYQLDQAVEVGFNVPETLITSDPEKVRKFYHNHNGNLVTKTLGVSPIPDKVLYTNRVTEKMMRDIDSLKLSPSIFQKEVEKAYELRITVVEEQTFTAKIHSQEDTKTSLDWRREPELNDYSVRMEKTSLPTSVIEQIQQLMSALNLNFGCIDMIVTPEGEYVFLEINPNGQWYFSQVRTGNDIARAIANFFIK